MRTKMMVRIAGCLMLALVFAGCGRSEGGNWKNTGMSCPGKDWDEVRKNNAEVAKVGRAFCGQDNFADDWRCKDKNIEAKCK